MTPEELNQWRNAIVWKDMMVFHPFREEEEQWKL